MSRNSNGSCLSRRVASISIDWGKSRRDSGILDHNSILASLLNRIVTRKLGEGSGSGFVPELRDRAVMVLLDSENALVSAALGITVDIACATINDLLKNPRLPSISEISVVAVTSSIAIREDERLVRVHCLVADVGEGTSIPVNLHEDARNVDGEVGVLAVTRVGSSRPECNMGFMVGRVGVLAIPATREVDLRANSTRAILVGQSGVLGSHTVEIQAQKVDSLLGEAIGVVCSLGGIAGKHPEVGRERGGGSRLVVIEVVNHSSSCETGERAVFPLEIKRGCPVIGLVLHNWHGRALTLDRLVRAERIGKVASTKDNVGVPRDGSRINDWVDSFNCKEIAVSRQEVGVGRCRKGERRERREGRFCGLQHGS